MSDPRLPAAEHAISDRYVTNPAIREAIAASILATFPDPRHGDLVVLRCPDPSEADARFAQSLASNLMQRGVQLVLLADADLTVIPPAEEVWRATWATQAAGRLAELVDELEEEAGRHRNGYERNAWAGAAERLRDAIPNLLDTAQTGDTTPHV